MPDSGQSFDRGDIPIADVADRHHATAQRFIVGEHRTYAADAYTAAVFGAFEPQCVTQYPEQRRIGSDVELVGCPIDDHAQHG